MRYTLQEKIDIGKQVHTHKISSREAEDTYGISPKTVCNYIREYKNTYDIKDVPSNQSCRKSNNDVKNIADYESMTKEELINELIRARVNEERAKKGYQVKGDGVNKEFTFLNSKNSK